MKQAVLSAAVLLATGAPVAAQLRIVTYNTLTATPDPALGIVLEAIGEESVNGIAKPVDILLLQEQDEPTTTTQAIVDILNGMYGSGAYSRTLLATGPSFSSIRQSAIYRTDTVELLQEATIAPLSQGGLTPPREAHRAKFSPVGYDSSAEFYIYNSHFKAGTESDDPGKRAAEAINLRADADALGEGAHVIFAGDFNLRNDGTAGNSGDPAEPAFQTLLASGPAQAFDPVADIAPAIWKNNAAAAPVHTHSGDDVDDRFDFQLPSGEWFDGEGLDFIAGSYRTFGNNGTTYNRVINSGLNTVEFDFGSDPTYTKSQVLSALRNASDHLPVVADYQLPAVFSASLVDVPTEVDWLSDASLTLRIENAAGVVAPNGADELDYTVTVFDGQFQTFAGTDLADGEPIDIQVSLNTQSLGQRFLSISVVGNGQGVGGNTFEQTLGYTVVIPEVPGDFDGNGFVTAADYTVWRDGLGTDYTPADYLVWRDNFNRNIFSPPLASAASPATTPEPPQALLLVAAVAVGAIRRNPARVNHGG
ncbi:MAG: hypothetical protein AAGB00_09315 [Planctomycetota bacterium]